MFTPNTTKPKRKSKRIYRDPYEYQLNKIPKKPHIHKPKDIYETMEYICSKCHEILGPFLIHNNRHEKVKNQEILIWRQVYEKSFYVIQGIEQLMANQENTFNDLFWKEILEEIPCPCNWYQVYQVFHKYRLTYYWTCFPGYVGLRPNLSQKILYYVHQYSDIGYTKYRISYMYLLYKFTQMFGTEEDADRIPVKGSSGWFVKTDEWWKQFCEEQQWEFIPSNRKIKLHWDKEGILKQLNANIFIAGLSTSAK